MKCVAVAAWHGPVNQCHKLLSATRLPFLLSLRARGDPAAHLLNNASRTHASPRRGASQPAAGESKAHRWPFLTTYDH